MRLIRTLTFLAASLLVSLQSIAQAPSNDQCSTARTVASGSTTGGATMNAADDLIGLLGCQSGAAVHPDVWYRITSTGSQMDFTLSPANSALAPNMEVLVFDGQCGTSLLLIGSQCGTGNITGQVRGLIPGRPYLVAVSSASPADTSVFTINLVTSTPPVTAAQDCDQAAIVSTLTPITQGVSNAGFGVTPDEVTTSNSCFGDQFGEPTDERQSKWFKFVVGGTGKLAFNINPNAPNDDYDWAVWDITTDPTDCTTKGNAIACNWTGARGATGLSLCPNQEPGFQGGDQFDNKTNNTTGAGAPIVVQAGRIYALLVDNYSVTNSGFTLTFGGACPNPPTGGPLALIILDAEFTYTKTSCSEVAFQKTNQIASTLGAQFFWNFGDGAVSSQQNPTHIYNPNGPTAYTVSLQVIDILGSRYTFSRQITIAPPVVQVVPSGSTTVCRGDSVSFALTGADSYTWSPANGLSVTNGANVTARPDSSTTYTVTAVRDMCTSTTTIQVDVVQPIQLAVSVPPPSICSGDSITLTATGGDSYEWSPATGLSSTTDSVVIAKPLQTTTYMVTARRGNCDTTQTVTVVVIPMPTTTVSASNTTPCFGEQSTLTVTGAARYEWSPATGLSSTTDSVVTANPTQTTLYTVTGFRGQCSTIDTVTIRVTPPATATGQVDATQGIVPFTANFTSLVPNGTAWLWNFGDGTTSTEETPSHTYATEGTYDVTLTAVYGIGNCSTTVEKIATLVAGPPKAYNVMTPNNDNMNDTFSAPVSGLAIDVKVFNRWGRQVFEQKNYKQDWKGDDLPAGTYYYHITDAAGKTWKGWLQIVR